MLAPQGGHRLEGPERRAPFPPRLRRGGLPPQAGEEFPPGTLALLAAGLSTTEELADRMYISPKTVKNHLADIYEKLGVNDRAQAAVEAIRLGLRE